MTRNLVLSWLTLLAGVGCGSSSADGGGGGTPGGGSSSAAGSTNMSSAGGAATAGGTSAGSAGSTATAGAPAGGGPAIGGTGGSGGNANAGTAGMPEGAAAVGNVACAQWPTATDEEEVDDTIPVADHYDGGMKRYKGAGDLGSGGDQEGQPAMFELDDGAVLENVIIGYPGADGVHCSGSCTLRNVYWEDVGEDAATLNGGSGSQLMTVECGGAKSASDKVFQHNGPGTILIKNFTVSDFDKLYRSCGNCDDQYERHVKLENVTGLNGTVLVGVNSNYGDTAEFTNVAVDRGVEICQRYIGTEGGGEPDSQGIGADPEHCLYQNSDIHILY